MTSFLRHATNTSIDLGMAVSIHVNGTTIGHFEESNSEGNFDCVQVATLHQKLSKSSASLEKNEVTRQKLELQLAQCQKEVSQAKRKCLEIEDASKIQIMKLKGCHLFYFLYSDNKSNSVFTTSLLNFLKMSTSEC